MNILHFDKENFVMITSSDVNKMCALLEPYDIGIALAKYIRTLYKRRLTNLDYEIRALHRKWSGDLTDTKLACLVQLEKQWHAANEVYVWVTNILDQEEVNNG
jgi:hypothetical protein